MGVRRFQKQWNELGKKDPLWAILTHPEKKGNKWKKDEFFRTGEEDVKSIIEYAESLGLEIPTGRALDFGCGVGRLTVALADFFDEVYGLDISPVMLELARSYNNKDNCKYFLNEKDNLRQFESESFNFVISMLTLQHIEPLHAKNYIKEFLRLLSPNGIMVFQITVPPKERISVLRRIRHMLLKNSKNPHGLFFIKKDELSNFIEKNGGKVIDLFEDGRAGLGYDSFQYCVKRLDVSASGR